MDVMATVPVLGSSITVAGIRLTKVTGIKTTAIPTTKINIEALANQKEPRTAVLLIFS